MTKNETERMTVRYQLIPGTEGNRYRFFCECSGIAVCTTEPLHAGTPEQELELAWENDGRKKFNRCQKCGRWVSNVMFNADTLECVECSPWEEQPIYCQNCGAPAPASGESCKKCGTKLRYGGTEYD
jgi:hypothetical protein